MTTTLGFPRRLDLDLLAVRDAVEDPVGDRDHGAVHRRVHVRAHGGAHVEAARARAGPALELVVAKPRPVGAEELLADPAEDARVRLRADRLERKRQRARRVVADRGDAALVDRQLKPQRVVHRDDLRPRRTGGQEPLRRCRTGGLSDRFATRACECREEEDDESDGSEYDERRKSACTANLRAFRLTERSTSGQSRCFGPSHPDHATRGLHQVQMRTGSRGRAPGAVPASRARGRRRRPASPRSRPYSARARPVSPGDRRVQPCAATIVRR